MENNNKNKEVKYDAFVAKIYDDAPTFGRWRNRNLDRLNKPYIEAVKQTGKRILEFGTATGMLTISLAREGFDVTSVDISPDMHEVVKRKLDAEEEWVAKNINLVNADVVEYHSDILYDVVAMPDGLFMAISDQKQQMKLLRNCRRNLRKGGKLCFEIGTPMSCVSNKCEYLYHAGSFTTYARFQFSENGDSYLMKLDTTTDPITQFCDFNYTFTKMNDNKSEECQKVNLTYRYIHYGEIVLMLEQSGFKVINIDINFFEDLIVFISAEKI